MVASGGHVPLLPPLGSGTGAIRTIFLGIVSIVQLAEVMDSAVLGGVVGVVSSNPMTGDKYFLAHLPS